MWISIITFEWMNQIISDLYLSLTNRTWNLILSLFFGGFVVFSVCGEILMKLNRVFASYKSLNLRLLWQSDKQSKSPVEIHMHSALSWVSVIWCGLPFEGNCCVFIIHMRIIYKRKRTNLKSPKFIPSAIISRECHLGRRNKATTTTTKHRQFYCCELS